MRDYNVPGLLTPEVIESLSKNAAAMKGMISSGEEVALLSGGCHGDDDCCCPKIVKIKNILSYVWIENINAACQDDDHKKKPRC